MGVFLTPKKALAGRGRNFRSAALPVFSLDLPKSAVQGSPEDTRQVRGRTNSVGRRTVHGRCFSHSPGGRTRVTPHMVKRRASHFVRNGHSAAGPESASNAPSSQCTSRAQETSPSLRAQNASASINSLSRTTRKQLDPDPSEAQARYLNSIILQAAASLDPRSQISANSSPNPIAAKRGMESGDPTIQVHPFSGTPYPSHPGGFRVPRCFTLCCANVSRVANEMFRTMLHHLIHGVRTTARTILCTTTRTTAFHFCSTTAVRRDRRFAADPRFSVIRERCGVSPIAFHRTLH